MNKKLLAILLAAVMLLALAACGDEPAPTPDPDPNPVETPEGGDEPQSVLTMFTLSQLDDYYMFYFNDESTVTLYEGADTATTGTYSAANETTVKIEVGGVTYAAVFAEGENGPIMVALLNSTGTNALIFEMVVEG